MSAPLPVARVHLLAGSQCPEVVAAGEAYLTSAEGAGGEVELALIRSGEIRRFGSSLKLTWRATPTGDAGTLVVGYDNTDARGPESFVHLDAAGREVCRETGQALTARAAHAQGSELEFYGLSAGAAIFLENSGGPASPSHHYALFPCRPPVPLGSCAKGENPAWEGGPVCLGERTFRVLDAGPTGDRSSADDQGYAASRHGILRVARLSSTRLDLSWIDRRTERIWKQAIELSVPGAEIASAAASDLGAVLWLLPPSSDRSGTTTAELLVLSRSGVSERRAIDLERSGQPRVAVGAAGWAAAIPVLEAQPRRVTCWFTEGGFPG